MTTETVPLIVPEDAVLRLHFCHHEAHLHEPEESCVRGISEPVVAAELRRLADSLAAASALPSSGTNRMGFRVAADRLRVRAAELDPS